MYQCEVRIYSVHKGRNRTYPRKPILGMSKVWKGWVVGAEPGVLSEHIYSSYHKKIIPTNNSLIIFLYIIFVFKYYEF